MMRFAVLAVGFCACASGSTNAVQMDAPAQQQQVDAKDYRDAPGQGEFQDAPAHHVDAFVYLDAPAVVTPDAPPDACVPVSTELLQNRAVDDTSPVANHWNQTLIDPGAPLITNSWATPDSPAYVAWLGGIDGSTEGTSSVTDTLTQDIAIPAGTTQLVLTGKYQVGTSETTTTVVYDTGTIDLVHTDNSPIETALSLSNLTTTTAWTNLSHTFTTNVAGQTVRLRLTTTNDSINSTGFLFDTLSLTATHCP